MDILLEEELAADSPRFRQRTLRFIDTIDDPSESNVDYDSEGKRKPTEQHTSRLHFDSTHTATTIQSRNDEIRPLVYTSASISLSLNESPRETPYSLIDEPDFRCRFCGKTFSPKDGRRNLYRHQKFSCTVKDATSDVRCEACNKKFKRPDALKKHYCEASMKGTISDTMKDKVAPLSYMFSYGTEPSAVSSSLPQPLQRDGRIGNYAEIPDAMVSNQPTDHIQRKNTLHLADIDQPTEPNLLPYLQPPTNIAIPSDSGYHTGIGKDTDSICSIDSFSSSLGLPGDFLQEFIAYIGDTLVEKTEAKTWGKSLRAHLSQISAESKIEDLLKEYSIKLITQSRSQEAVDQQLRHSWLKAAKLVRIHRPKIARYFCNHGLVAATPTESLDTRLKNLGQQLSVLEKMELAAKLNPTMAVPTALNAQLRSVDDDFEEVILNLEPLRDFLESGEAFHELTTGIRNALLWPQESIMDQIRNAVLGNLSPLGHADVDRLETHTAIFMSDWKVPDFLSTQFGEVFKDQACPGVKNETDDVEIPFRNLSGVVTLSGTVLAAHATTCAEYMDQVWPGSKEGFLPYMCSVLSASNNEWEPYQEPFKKLQIRSRFTHGNKRVINAAICGTKDEIVEFAQQFTWFISALSTPKDAEGLSYAKASVTYDETATVFNVTVKHELLSGEESACWLPLFSGASIAYGFPVPERQDEIGLEAPTQLMAALAGVRHAFEFEGGVVMKGFSTMFVPVKKNQDRIQWHLVTSKDLDTRLTYRDGISQCSSRAMLDQVNLDDVQKCRSIVGWCTKVTSILGTQSADYENLDYSGAEEASSTIRLSSGSIGFQQFGVGTIDFKLGAKDGPFHFQRGKRPFQRIISAAEKERVLLYDTSGKCAWLVPAVEVILHIAQQRNHLLCFQINEKPVILPWRIPCTSPRDLILHNANMNLSDFGAYTFMDLIQDIWSDLEYLIGLSVNRESATEGRAIRDPFSEHLQGFEFRAIVEERSSSRRKQTMVRKTSGGWPALVRDIDALVLFANGFGQILRPVLDESTRLCHRWKSVPEGKDYLATTIEVMKDLYNVAGCRTSRAFLTDSRLRWHTGQSITFEACDSPSKFVCKCDRLQRIVSKTAMGKVVSPSVLKDEGAVIFGQCSNLLTELLPEKPHQETHQRGFYTQPNDPLPVLTMAHQYAFSDEESSSIFINEDDDSTERGTNITLSRTVPSAVSSSTSNISYSTEATDPDGTEAMALTSPPQFLCQKRGRAFDEGNSFDLRPFANTHPINHCASKRTKFAPIDDSSSEVHDTACSVFLTDSQGSRKASLGRYSRHDSRHKGRLTKIGQSIVDGT